MKSQRWKDFWTLHVPLIIVTALVIYATLKQYGRAQEGNGRSWVYTFQWPIIGVFALVVWNRYRKHGNVTQWFTKHYRERAERFAAEAEEQERREKEKWARDPDAQAWAEYQRTMREQDKQEK